jgi:hypothetical protein
LHPCCIGCFSASAEEPSLEHNPNVVADLLGSIIKNEQGREPFTPAQLQAAVAAALREVGQGGGSVTVTLHNVPAGTMATASHSDAWPVRMQYGLPTGATNP